MSEEQRMEAIEREMMAMRPKGVPARVMDSLVEGMEERRAWGDWMLVGAMGSGVAAALVIVSMILVQGAAEAPVGVGPVMAEGRPQRAGDYLAMYARAGGDWDGVVK